MPQEAKQRAVLRPFALLPRHAGMMLPDPRYEPVHPSTIHDGTKPASVMLPPGNTDPAHEAQVLNYLQKVHKNFLACEQWLKYQHYYLESYADSSNAGARCSTLPSRHGNPRLVQEQLDYKEEGLWT